MTKINTRTLLYYTHVSSQSPVIKMPTHLCDTSISYFSDGYVTCNATLTCIPSQWICDTIPDCEDGEDEVNCPCQDFQFTCVNETAGVHENFTSYNYYNYYYYGYDNYGYNYGYDYMFNGPEGGKCLNVYRVCDNVTDCADGSDEWDCGSCETNETR